MNNGVMVIMLITSLYIELHNALLTSQASFIFYFQLLVNFQMIILLKGGCNAKTTVLGARLHNLPTGNLESARITNIVPYKDKAEAIEAR